MSPVVVLCVVIKESSEGFGLGFLAWFLFPKGSAVLLFCWCGRGRAWTCLISCSDVIISLSRCACESESFACCSCGRISVVVVGWLMCWSAWALACLNRGRSLVIAFALSSRFTWSDGSLAYRNSALVEVIILALCLWYSGCVTRFIPGSARTVYVALLSSLCSSCGTGVYLHRRVSGSLLGMYSCVYSCEFWGWSLCCFLNISMVRVFNGGTSSNRLVAFSYGGFVRLFFSQVMTISCNGRGTRCSRRQ